MKKLFIICALAFLLMPVVLATENLGTFKQNDCVELIQTCANCTYVNISSVSYPDSAVALYESQMTKNGTRYNYTDYCLTSKTGTYTVNGFGDPDATVTIWNFDFEITPTGITQGSIWNNPILLIFVTLGIVLLLLGLGFKLAPLGFMSGVMFMLLGVYTMIYGFNNITDLYTRSVAIVILSLGFLISLVASWEAVSS